MSIMSFVDDRNVKNRGRFPFLVIVATSPIAIMRRKCS